MSGHSKWANIKFRKAAQDQKRGKVFTKLIREITVAARMGGGDPSTNPRLRLAMDKALSDNMTKDTINRAIARGTGEGSEAAMEEIIYEGYGPGGTAVLVKCLTDNRNRTVAEVRHAFTKAGGNLGTSGSVSYLFTEQGFITFPKGSDEDKITHIALETNAEDVAVNEDGSIDVITAVSDFSNVKQAMEKAGLTPEHAEVTMIPSNKVLLNQETAEKFLRMVDALEELDDVQDVYSNADIPEEVIN
ncbi:MAG: YebC/PmpR family DNA-binding transcriptional regulator [Gammaproteobacteria bacterium]|nr:YebC/PmpR family DNA-binding transcriptional regulator [Gammaproteobacteria bacterium]